jgi:integrase
MTTSDIAQYALRGLSRKSDETALRYRPIIEHFASQFRGIEIVSITPQAIEEFCLAGGVAPSTALVRASAVRGVFKEAQRAGLKFDNPCELLDLPSPEPKLVDPYTTQEIREIMIACRTNREHAMASLLFSAAPRIRDLVTMPWSAIENGRVHLIASKNKREIWLPLSPDAKRYIEQYRIKRAGCSYLFWSGESEVRTVVRNAQVTLRRVFDRSGVEGAYAHRARHTLATRILGVPGTTMQDVADILGITLAVAEARYAKWSEARQSRVDGLLKEAWVL